MRINHNMSSLKAAQQLRYVNKRLSLASARLSSGSKINSVRDDAAGMSISTKLDNQVKGLEKANENTLNGISLVQTVDGVLSSINSMVQKIRELAVQSVNDTNTTSDRAKIQKEVSQLKEEIDSLSKRTSFNNIEILNGDAARLVYNENSIASKVTYVSEGVRAGELEYTINQIGTPASADITQLPEGIVPLNVEGMVKINGAEVFIKKEDTANDINAKMSQGYASAGLEIINTATGDKIVSLEEGRNIEIEVSGSDLISGIGYNISNSVPGTDAQVTLNSYTDSEFYNNHVITSKGNHIEILGNGGERIDIDLNFSISSTGVYELNDGSETPQDAGGPITLTAKITNDGGIKIQLGQGKDMEVDMYIDKVNLKTLGLEHINLTTHIGSSNAIENLDIAIEKIATLRVKAGAYQNRFEFTSTNLNTTTDNTIIALSRIRDTDMAREMTEYSKNQVIYQAGISILSQSNQRPQQILQLLG